MFIMLRKLFSFNVEQKYFDEFRDVYRLQQNVSALIIKKNDDFAIGKTLDFSGIYISKNNKYFPDIYFLAPVKLNVYICKKTGKIWGRIEEIEKKEIYERDQRLVIIKKVQGVKKLRGLEKIREIQNLHQK